MDTLKKLVGKSIVTAIAAYNLLLILFPVGWIVFARDRYCTAEH